jgi:hypothetical protein
MRRREEEDKVYIEIALDDLLCRLYMEQILTFLDFSAVHVQATPQAETGKVAQNQGILNPIQSQAKEAFINTLCAINQSYFVFGDNLPGLEVIQK